MPVDALFLYGTLRHAPLFAAVAGCPLHAQEAWLPDHAVTQAVAANGGTLDFPLFTARPGAEARGLLIRPDPEARTRLDAYERVFGYDPVPVIVQDAAGPVAATIYLPRGAMWTAGPDWSLEDWAASGGDLATEVAADVMALLDEAAPEAVLHRYGMLAIRAASRRRARSQPAPASLRRVARAGDVSVETLRTPYTWFFGVEEAELRFRQFGGGFSARVNRAGFIMGDAVTVLPYDPARDRVMLVEQFRFGAYARGDANPWSLEPIAGRIDAGEEPEAAARREAAEEADLALGVLHRASSYYVSPGAVTEFLFSYVGIADLPDGIEGVSGLDSEAEDIRSHVIPFERLMALLESGEAANGPLIISAQWLALNRERLRAAAR